MTFLELVNELRRECSVAGNAVPSVTGQSGEYQRLIRWIQQAHEEIQGMYFDWLFLRADNTFITIAGIDIVTPPANLNVWDMNRFYDGSINIDCIEWSDYIPSDAASGKPYEFTIKPDNTIKLYPEPDGAYTFSYEYFKTPMVLVLDADEPLIPKQFQRAIVYRAMVMYANYEEAAELKMQGSELYQEAIRQLRNHQLPQKQRYYGKSDSDMIQVVAE